MRRFLFGLMVSLWATTATAQPVYHIYLMGDGGKDPEPARSLLMLETELKANPNSAVIFLGDNIYPDGLSGADGSEQYKKNEQRLLAQLDRTKDHPGHVIWIPGNHDWHAGKWRGHKMVKREQTYIEQYYRTQSKAANRDSALFIPFDGLPGPVLTRLPNNLSLVAFDLQWWLQSQFFHKVPKPNGLSRKGVTRKFIADMDTLIAREQALGRQVIVASHHPMFSNGHHGAPKQPLRFLINCTPFQLFGLLGLNRGLVQDIPQPRYKRMRKRILQVFDRHKGLIHVAGHEHTLQYFAVGDDHFLVSGAGSKHSSLVSDRYPAKFMDDRSTGFMRLDLMPDGTWKCKVFTAQANGVLDEFELN